MKKLGKERLIILGCGLFAEEVADYISTIRRFELVGFVEGLDREKCARTLLGLPILWLDDLGKLDDRSRPKAVCAVGTTKRKKFIEQAASSGIEFAKIVHPGSLVSPTGRIGEGTIISPGAIVAAGTNVGRHVILNRGSLIGHHTEIGDYVTVSPGANIAGKTRVGELCYIGMGAVILDGITIGNNSVVGAGSVVTKDVPSSVQVLGVPARISKEIR